MPYFVYVLECSNGAHYTGYTTDMARRYAEHLEGSGKCKYTRSYPPKALAACWELHLDLSHALKIERSIKKLTKKEKVALVKKPLHIHALLAKKGYEDKVLQGIQLFSNDIG